MIEKILFTKENVAFEDDGRGGAFISYKPVKASEKYDFLLCRMTNAERFSGSYLADPFFMKAFGCNEVSEVFYETQWLAIKLRDGKLALFIPLAADKYRASLHGGKEGLYLTAECGRNAATDEAFTALYYIDGNDISVMMSTAFKSIKEKFGIRLAEDKPKPPFMQYFGWCSWNAFYERVTEEDMRNALEEFKKSGFVPRFILLDDGWQSVRDVDDRRGHTVLSDFLPNQKFKYDLTSLSADMKEKYGVKCFMVWHAAGGYWGGADPESNVMQKYGIKWDRAEVTSGEKLVNPRRSESEYFDFGLVDDFDAFYDDYHKLLKSQGVDGVKVDVQSIIASHGDTGRIAITRKMRKALEASVNKNFNGNLINCMANTNEILFSMTGSNMQRTSGDFRPNDPKETFRHVLDNAVNSFFVGNFAVCDWDMFWTYEENAEYHAMARAVSGGPVYVSDECGKSNKDIIERLTTSDGKLLLCNNVAEISSDSLFADFEADREPLTVTNRNKYGIVTGVFSPYENEELEFDVDVPEGFVLRTFTGKNMLPGKHEYKLLPMGSDIFTMMPVKNGFAVFGLTEKYNGGAAVTDIVYNEKSAKITLSDGGKVLLYFENEGRVTSINDKPVDNKLATGFAEIDTETEGKTEIIISL